MKRRGFTMIEILIVLAILAVVTAPFLLVVGSQYGNFQALFMQSSLEHDGQAAAARVFRRLGSGGRCVLDADNHGLRFPDGSRVGLRTGRLELVDQGRTTALLAEKVRDFTVTRQAGTLTLNLDVETRGSVHGRLRLVHLIYDFPEVGLP